MKDARHGATSGEILREIGIFKGRGSDGFPSWHRHVMRHFFLGITMHAACPITCEVIQVRAVGNFGAESDGTFRVFLEVTTDTVQTIEMTNFWGSTEPPHGHGCTVDVAVAKRDCPHWKDPMRLWQCLMSLGPASSLVSSSG
jgi:hypothetical protein